MKTLTSIEQKKWDFIIVGTGMGAGPIGLRLAQSGYSVLFLEKGRSPRSAASIKGVFAEAYKNELTKQETLKNAGRFADEIYDTSGKKIKSLRPFIGTGVGGSSALYGMVLERFQASDIISWPVSYESFQKYYSQAENLFQVQTQRQIANPDLQKLESFLYNRGLHPYSLPLANDNHAECGNCQSMLCKHNCKNDSGKMCIEPAVNKYNSELLTECVVEKVETTQGNRATGVLILHNGHRRTIHGQNVILAAGALSSPLILQKSSNSVFPQGLGNQSGFVGRYLMRHFVDLYALKIDTDTRNKNVKEIGLNDFYELNGKKAGTVQSFGRMPPVSVILAQIQTQLDGQLKWFGRILFTIIQPFLMLVLRQLTKNRLVMASIIEDAPQFENRVWQENGKTFIHYKIAASDKETINLMRNKLKRLFAPLGLWFIAASEKNEMLAHACGTCRMGENPDTSVVDTNNRVHNMENLYVVDSSFFPTSGGTNPALTIAANSLRVADLLIANMKARESSKEKHYSHLSRPDHQ